MKLRTLRNEYPFKDPAFRTSVTSADGTIHFFHEIETNKTLSLVYSVLHPNTPLINKKIIAGKNTYDRFDDMSAQVSANGKHILVSYIGSIFYFSHCGLHNEAPCSDIRLI
jgi:hypothetical protein